MILFMKKIFFNTQEIDKDNYDFNFGYIYVNDEDNTQKQHGDVTSAIDLKNPAFFNMFKMEIIFI